MNEWMFHTVQFVTSPTINGDSEEKEEIIASEGIDRVHEAIKCLDENNVQTTGNEIFKDSIIAQDMTIPVDVSAFSSIRSHANCSRNDGVNDLQEHDNYKSPADSNNNNHCKIGLRKIFDNEDREHKMPSLCNSSIDTMDEQELHIPIKYRQHEAVEVGMSSCDVISEEASRILHSPRQLESVDSIADSTLSECIKEEVNIAEEKGIDLKSSQMNIMHDESLNDDSSNIIINKEPDSDDQQILNNHDGECLSIHSNGDATYCKTSHEEEVVSIAEEMVSEIVPNPLEQVDRASKMCLILNDGIQVFDIDKLYIEACNNVMDKSHKNHCEIDQEQSDSQTISFHTCRENSIHSVVDHSENASSTISFYTAQNHSNDTRTLSEKDITSEHLGSDFLTCRSNDDVSSHVYDLSYRIDDRSDRDTTTSVHSYHTCRRFNSQGLLSIMKKNVDDGNEDKKFNIPIDVITLSSQHDQSKILRKKFYIGMIIALVLLVIFAITATIILLTQKKMSNEVHVAGEQLYNTTFAPIPVANTIPSPSPINAPPISIPILPQILDNFNPSQVPSLQPTIQPTTSRHRDNIFLRPPKKIPKKSVLKILDMFN